MVVTFGEGGGLEEFDWEGNGEFSRWTIRGRD
jgi:hypothetical protein